MADGDRPGAAYMETVRAADTKKNQDKWRDIRAFEPVDPNAESDLNLHYADMEAPPQQHLDPYHTVETDNQEPV